MQEKQILFLMVSCCNQELHFWALLNLYDKKLSIHPVKTEYVFSTQQWIALATLADGPFSLFLEEKHINQAQHYNYTCTLMC